jgi:hypothetical protein
MVTYCGYGLVMVSNDSWMVLVRWQFAFAIAILESVKEL